MKTTRENRPVAATTNRSVEFIAEKPSFNTNNRPDTQECLTGGGNRLPVLQKQIAEAVSEVGRYSDLAAERALSAGSLLREAKSLCGHGNWAAYLREIDLPERTAQRYMALAAAGFKTAIVADLGVSHAARLATAGLRLCPKANSAAQGLGGFYQGERLMAALSFWWRESDTQVRYWHMSSGQQDQGDHYRFTSMPIWALPEVVAADSGGYEEGLQQPHRHKKRKRLYHHDASVIRLRPKYPNHIWSIDFVHDKLSNGRPYKMLTVLDEYTREALRVAVAARMGAAEVLEALYPLLLQRGKPEYIRSDNGPEFTAAPFKEWLRRVGIEPIHIYPGSPWENGYNERFNGTLRREVLNAEWFASIRQAQTVINLWLRQYNHIRPHHALGMRAPVPETLIEKSQIGGTDIGG